MSFSRIFGLIVFLLFYGGYAVRKHKDKKKPHHSYYIPSEADKKIVQKELAYKLASFLLALAQLLCIIFDYTIVPIGGIRVIGFIICAAGIGISALAVYCMSAVWSNALEAKHIPGLVTDRIYEFSRHPFYVGFIVFHFGMLASFFNVWTILLTAVEYVLLCMHTRTEEDYLYDRFGAEYEAYCKQTPRYVFFL